MEINDIVNSFAQAIAEARAKHKQMEEEVAELENERIKLLQAKPHTTEVVAAFMRGISAAQKSFEDRLKWFFQDDSRRMGSFATQTRSLASQLLMVEGTKPDPAVPFPHYALGAHQKDIDVAAVTYFLAPLIAKELPALIERVYPAGVGALTFEQREAKIAELDQRIATAKAERDELHAHITAATRAPHKQDAYGSSQ